VSPKLWIVCLISAEELPRSMLGRAEIIGCTDKLEFVVIPSL